MRRVASLMVVLLVTACSVTPPPPPGPPWLGRAGPSHPPAVTATGFPLHFSVTLKREYGSAAARECSITVLIVDGGFDRRSSVERRCAFHAGPPTVAQLELSVFEATGIAVAAERSRPFDYGHAGEDWTWGDGLLDTLRVHDPYSGRAAILIVSQNKTFEIAPARRDLLERLRKLEEELSEGRPALQELPALSR